MNLIAKLKEEGQDFEFYPTTPAMIHAGNSAGCGEVF